MERRHERLIIPARIRRWKNRVEAAVWKGGIVDCSGVVESEIILF